MTNKIPCDDAKGKVKVYKKDSRRFPIINNNKICIFNSFFQYGPHRKFCRQSFKHIARGIFRSELSS